MKTYWRKPYYRIKERDYGSYQFAFVVYDKHATCFKHVDRGPHPEGQIQAIPIAWRYYLRIDLYFCILDFTWNRGSIKRVDGI